MLFPTIYQTLAIPKHYMTCCRSRPQFPHVDPTPLRSWATWYVSKWRYGATKQSFGESTV